MDNAPITPNVYFFIHCSVIIDTICFKILALNYILLYDYTTYYLIIMIYCYIIVLIGCYNPIYCVCCQHGFTKSCVCALLFNWFKKYKKFECGIGMQKWHTLGDTGCWKKDSPRSWTIYLSQSSIFESSFVGLMKSKAIHW